MAHALIEAWRAQRFNKPPYILHSDIIPDSKRVIIGSHEELIKRENYAVPDPNFHLGLLPVPFIGDLEKADIYVGLINPGLDVGHDYYVEATRADFCGLLRRNLKQEFRSASYPFFLLDPKWHWTGAGRWWHGLLGDIIRELMKMKRCSYIGATSILASRIAALELVPYHSSNSSYIPGGPRLLESSRLMRTYVDEVIVPRTKRDDALLVITRGRKKWGIAKGRNIVVYESSQARSASLSLKSGGGRRIVDWLLKGN